jgi:hypothetical protein
MYRDKFFPIVTSLGWTFEIINEKFDKAISNKIIALLTGSNTTNYIYNNE